LKAGRGGMLSRRSPKNGSPKSKAKKALKTVNAGINSISNSGLS